MTTRSPSRTSAWVPSAASSTRSATTATPQYLTEEEYKIEQEVLQGPRRRHRCRARPALQRPHRHLRGRRLAGGPGWSAGRRHHHQRRWHRDRPPAPGRAGRARAGRAGHARSQLGIERPGETERQRFSIRRDDIEIDPVAWAMAPGSDVAVVRVVQFSVGAGHQVREAVEQAPRPWRHRLRAGPARQPRRTRERDAQRGRRLPR